MIKKKGDIIGSRRKGVENIRIGKRSWIGKKDGPGRRRRVHQTTKEVVMRKTKREKQHDEGAGGDEGGGWKWRRLHARVERSSSRSCQRLHLARG